MDMTSAMTTLHVKHFSKKSIVLYTFIAIIKKKV